MKVEIRTENPEHVYNLLRYKDIKNVLWFEYTFLPLLFDIQSLSYDSISNKLYCCLLDTSIGKYVGNEEDLYILLKKAKVYNAGLDKEQEALGLQLYNSKR